MRISVVVPTRQMSKDLERCISSLRNQSEKIYEIIIVSPKNEEIERFAKKTKCKWYEDKKNKIGNAYYVGACQSKGDFAAFIDDDCVAPKNWLSLLVKDMKNEDLDIAGGDDIIDERTSTKFQKTLFLIDMARSSNVQLYGKDACRRLRACNIIFKRSVFEKQNFNRNLSGLQEPELLHRLEKDGKKIKFNGNITVFHSRRNNISGLFNQIYRNGIAKIDLIKIHKDIISTYDIAALFAFSATIFLLLFSIINKTPLLLWIGILAIYFILKPLYILLKVKK
ncbi:glycosyltransferase [archaeon]|nr:glycosyltransferase [archaeon]